MTNENTQPTIPCPNCHQPMQIQNFEQNYHGVERIDVCFGCAGIWFDHLASVQLAPGAVIELFKEINAQLNATHQPVAAELKCPRCGDALALGSDLCKSGKFSYYRCLRGDGRFTPFFQFLREKQFVRNLTAAELQRVRSQVRQIQCSECGAPIDLEHNSICEHCHAPVSFLDPDAVQKAMKLWSDAESHRQLSPAPQLAHDSEAPPPATLSSQLSTASDGVDLVAMGVRAIGRLFDRG